MTSVGTREGTLQKHFVGDADRTEQLAVQNACQLQHMLLLPAQHALERACYRYTVPAIPGAQNAPPLKEPPIWHLARGPFLTFA